MPECPSFVHVYIFSTERYSKYSCQKYLESWIYKWGQLYMEHCFLSASENIHTNEYPIISVEETMTTNERTETNIRVSI